MDTSDTYAPLPESAFKFAIADNYMSSTSSQFAFELDMDQVARLSDAFKQFAISRTTPVPNNAFSPFNGSAHEAVPLFDEDAAPSWTGERTRRFSPVGVPPPAMLGRPKSSIEHLTGHTPHFESDFNLLGSGFGLPNQQLTKSRLSLDANLLQTSQLNDLLGAVAGGNIQTSSLLNSVNFDAAQALQNAALLREASSWTQGQNPSVLSGTGMMPPLGDAASSQLMNQTRIGLGLNTTGQTGLSGRFSSGNLNSVEAGDLWSHDPTINAFGLPTQNLDLQISQPGDVSLSGDDQQGSKIWKVSSKDMGLLPDTRNVLSGAFTFQDQRVGQLQGSGGSTAGVLGTILDRFQDTWGPPNPTQWKPPRPHSSADGEGLLFSRGNLQGLDTMYPDPKAQVQLTTEESGLQTKSTNNGEVGGLSDGGSPSETPESPLKEQVNIKALEDESLAINQYNNLGSSLQTNDFFLEKPPPENSGLFGFSSGGFYPTAETLISKGNIPFANCFNPGLGEGQNLLSTQSATIAEFGKLLLPTEPSFTLPPVPTIGQDLAPITGTEINTSNSTSHANLEPELNRFTPESKPLMKQVLPSKKQKPLNYINSNSEVDVLTDIILLGGLNDSNMVKSFNTETPEEIKKTEIDLSFCRGAGVNIGSHVFLLGGISPDSLNKPTTGLFRMEPLNPEFKDIKELTSMNTERCLFGAATSGMKIFAIGGNTEQGPTDTVEIYDPIVDSWSLGPSLNSAKHSLGTTVVNNVIYTVGGQSEKGALQTVEMLDPRQGKWIQIGSLSWSRAGLACCPIGNHLFAAGGHNGKTVVNSGEVLDLRKGIVNQSLTLIEARQYGVALLIGNSVYLIGGLESSDLENGLKFSRPEIFNTVSGNSEVWNEASEEQLALVFHSACAIPRCLY